MATMATDPSGNLIFVPVLIAGGLLFGGTAAYTGWQSYQSTGSVFNGQVWGAYGSSVWDSVRSIYFTYTGDFNTAYDLGPLGQTSDGPHWVYYGTRGAFCIATIATATAVLVGGVEFFFLGNNSLLVEGGHILTSGSGGIFQIRPHGGAPWFRLDWHPLQAGGWRLPHIDMNAVGVRHWPWNWFGW
jgi:hypothetical protein